jgi:hypothetical protein
LNAIREVLRKNSNDSFSDTVRNNSIPKSTSTPASSKTNNNLKSSETTVSGSSIFAETNAEKNGDKNDDLNFEERDDEMLNSFAASGQLDVVSKTFIHNQNDDSGLGNTHSDNKFSNKIPTLRTIVSQCLLTANSNKIKYNSIIKPNITRSTSTSITDA